MKTWTLLALAAAAIASNDDVASVKDMTAFVQYMTEYNKPYRNHADDHPLMAKRFQAFRTNLRRIEEHNEKYDAGEVTFTLGLNELADLTDEEYKGLLGYKRLGERPQAAFTHTADEFTPDSWDWREHNVVTPVKNQGMCGSCWAFSAVASMESVYALATGKLESFSEQELVDCCDNGEDTCNHGGEMSHGFIEIIEHHGGKIDPESVYPYTMESKGVCHAKDNQALGHFTAYANVTSGDEDALKSASASAGVISVAIDASSFMFQLYRHGVFSWPLCKNKSEELDHGVAVAGFGNYKGKDFWLVKNSWGEGWGMHGYILMSRNKDNQCGIATDASYPIMPKQKIKDESSPRVVEDALMAFQ